ncbi:MAG: hypothetical protein OK457_01745 [Thaumarchaeota archaeon]|nr:hypothetical protein [Nitrososphaerota archaeon]
MKTKFGTPGAFVSMDCHYCGAAKEGLPFRCNYCGEFFCGEHRLPENHACPRVGGPRQPGYAQVRRYTPQSRDRPSLPFTRSNRSRFRLRYVGIFSKTEERHVLAATAVMVLAGLTIGDVPLFSNFSLPKVVFLIPGFVISFLGHELAHKFLARRNGLWAEFRTNMYGLLLTAVSAVFPFKFLAPGQVNIQGTGSREVMGAIGLVGPGFNIAIAVLGFILSRFSGSFFDPLFLKITIFNGYLAVINLIPFGSLDGTRVFMWDKTRWAIALAASILLLAVGYYYLGSS